MSLLSELASVSRSIKSEDDLAKTNKKYNMVFMGEKFNIISSLELRHALSKAFDIEISDIELASLIPDACSVLGMEIHQFVAVNASRDILPNYHITLW